MNVVEYFQKNIMPTLAQEEAKRLMYWFSIVSFLEVEAEWLDTAFPYQSVSGNYKKWCILMWKEGFGLEIDQARIRLGSDWSRSKLRDYPHFIELSSHPEGNLGEMKVKYAKLLAGFSLYKGC